MSKEKGKEAKGSKGWRNSGGQVRGEGRQVRDGKEGKVVEEVGVWKLERESREGEIFFVGAR